MVRRLKHHEAKLLRKTDFIEYKSDKGHRDADVRRRYMIQKPEDYVCQSLESSKGLLTDYFF